MLKSCVEICVFLVQKAGIIPQASFAGANSADFSCTYSQPSIGFSAYEFAGYSQLKLSFFNQLVGSFSTKSTGPIINTTILRSKIFIKGR